MASSTESQSAEPNHDSEIIAVVACFSTLSLIALSLRLMSKRMKGARFYYDDYLATISWVLTLAEGVMVASETRVAGLGRHVSSLNEADVTAFLKIYYAFAFLQTTALATAKLSVLVLLHGIFIGRTFRLTAKILGVIVVSWWISFMFTYAFICSPIRANWEPTIPHHCGDTKVANIFAPAPWILTDFAILIAPIPVIKNLQMRRSDKIGISALFLTGGMTCVIACYRYSTVFFSTTDITWDTTNVAIWSVIETNASVVCACFITIRPALKYFFPEKFINITRRSWSRLLSSRSRRSPRAQRESDTNLFDSVTHLGEAPQPFQLFDEPPKNSGTQIFQEPQSVPLQNIGFKRTLNSTEDAV